MSPLKKSGGRASVSYNIAELKAANRQKPAGKKRSRAQILAISLSSVYGKRKKK